jgi:hypothetical protein
VKYELNGSMRAKILRHLRELHGGATVSEWVSHGTIRSHVAVIEDCKCEIARDWRRVRDLAPTIEGDE